MFAAAVCLEIEVVIDPSKGVSVYNCVCAGQKRKKKKKASAEKKGNKNENKASAEMMQAMILDHLTLAHSIVQGSRILGKLRIVRNVVILDHRGGK